MKKRSLKNSKALLKRARRVIPRASQTLSKAPDQFVEGVSPYAIARGKGAYVWDVDGNNYIDLTTALGGMILGYAHPAIERAVAKQRKQGTIFGLPAAIEVEFAEELTAIAPFIEMVRFGLNGSDATTAAVRVARAYTGRDHIAKCGYHGWADWSIATHPLRSGGIPQPIKDLTHEFVFNDIKSLEKIFKAHPTKIAAVVMEPMHASLPKPGFLKAVKRACHKNGAVLVFDELITGFRLAMGGAAEYFGVEPDLACYGKALASGEPISVLAGRKKIMEVLDKKDIFFSFTYAGYTPAIAAARETLKFMKQHNLQRVLFARGESLAKRYNALAKRFGVPTSAGGVGPVQFWIFKNKDGSDNLPLKSLFIQECAKAGILTNCTVHINWAHDEKTLRTLFVRLEAIFKILAGAIKKGNAKELLEGPMLRPRARPSN